MRMSRDLYEHRTRYAFFYDLALDNPVIRATLKIASAPFLAHYPGSDFKPIFIVGPARSGTTLVYQYLVYVLKVCFITNLMNRYPEGAVILWRSLGRAGARDSTFSNALGRTVGINGPSQGIAFWERLYQEPSEENEALVTTTIASLQKYERGPFVSKWQGHNPHIQLLDRIFSSPVFLLVTRDAGNTALSVHSNWKKIGRDVHSPLSKPTRSYHQAAGDDLFHNACAYVAAARTDLETDLAQVRYSYRISYEEFCASPRSEAERFVNWYFGIGQRLQSRDPRRLEEVSSFEIKRYPSSEVCAYRRAVENFERQMRG
jgi:hypothetical protein